MKTVDFFLLGMFVGLSLFGGRACLGESYDPVSVHHSSALRNIGLKNKAQKEAVFSWSGCVTVHSQISDGSGKTINERKTKMTFWADVSRAYLLTNRSDVISKYENKEGQIVDAPLEIGGALIKDGLIYQYSRYNPKGPLPNFSEKGETIGFLSENDPRSRLPILRGRVVIMKEHSNQVELNPFSGFDPFSWRGPPESNFATYFLSCAELVQKNQLKNHDICIAEDTITLRSAINGNYNLYKADIRSGMGLVYATYNEKNPQYNMQFQVEYTTMNNTCLPLKSILSTENKKNSLELHWSQHEINSPISPDVFSLKKLGIFFGDVVYDHQTERSYIIDDTSFPPLIVEENFRRYPSARLFIMLAGIILIITALLMKYRQWRSN